IFPSLHSCCALVGRSLLLRTKSKMCACAEVADRLAHRRIETISAKLRLRELSRHSDSLSPVQADCTGSRELACEYEEDVPCGGSASFLWHYGLWHDPCTTFSEGPTLRTAGPSIEAIAAYVCTCAAQEARGALCQEHTTPCHLSTPRI